MAINVKKALVPWAFILIFCLLSGCGGRDAAMGQEIDNTSEPPEGVSTETPAPDGTGVEPSADATEDPLPSEDPSPTEEPTEGDDGGETLKAEILAEADALRQSILENPGTPEIAGTTYYVSGSGDDKNDGKTPETAWASLDRVSAPGLRPGDGVLFERGGVYRGYLRCWEGVTYSTYGSGDMPVITGSPENGAGAEKWTLFGQTADGGKIWKYHRDMTECGTLLLNGETWIYKVRPYWSGSGYVTQDGEPFDVLRDMTEDMTFFSPADSLLPKSDSPFLYLGDAQFMGTSGPLYFRCDRGNPGEVFESIEFCARRLDSSGVVDLASDCLVEGLSIKYTSDCGVMPGSAQKGAVIRNCEIAWCGGGILNYDDRGAPVLAGDGFCLASGGITIQNCYIHDNSGNGITIECGTNPGRVVAGVTVLGCLITNNTGGVHICCYDEDMIAHNMTYRDFLIKDNYILFSGNGWGLFPPGQENTDFLAAGCSIQMGDVNVRLYAPNTVFENNVIYSDSVCNIWGAFLRDTDLPRFVGNRIYGRSDIMTALWSPKPGENEMWRWYVLDGEGYDAQELFNQELGSGNILGYTDK